VQEILAYLKTNHTTFLDGYGKTSALRAGVVPALVRAGHLPLLVSVSTEPLETTIKKQILPNIEAKEFLRKMPLAEFIRRISDKLEQGKNLYILVDNFETLYAQPDTARQAFKLEWELCASEIACDIHWLFAVPSGSTNLLKIFKEKAPVNVNLVTLQPLGPEEAREVILRTAGLGHFEHSWKTGY
jgi:hypothetical protein